MPNCNLWTENNWSATCRQTCHAWMKPNCHAWRKTYSLASLAAWHSREVTPRSEHASWCCFTIKRLIFLQKQIMFLELISQRNKSFLFWRRFGMRKNYLERKLNELLNFNKNRIFSNNSCIFSGIEKNK